MPTPIEIVERFCATWDQGMETVRRAVNTYFMPGTVWENVGWSLTTGPDEALELWQTFEDRGFPHIKVEMIHVAAVGEVVLTERVDHLQDVNRNTVMSARLMGVFELKNGKIASWRDYTDPDIIALIPRVQHT